MSLPLGNCSPPGLLGATLNQLGKATMSVMSTMLLHVSPSSSLSNTSTCLVLREKRRKILPAVTSSIGAGLPGVSRSTYSNLMISYCCLLMGWGVLNLWIWGIQSAPERV